MLLTLHVEQGLRGADGIYLDIINYHVNSCNIANYQCNYLQVPRSDLRQRLFMKLVNGPQVSQIQLISDHLAMNRHL